MFIRSFLIILILLPNVLADRKVSPKESFWVKILSYHEIIPQVEFDKEWVKETKANYLIVPAENFAKQMEFIWQNYTVVSLRDFVKHIDNQEPYSSNAIIVTIDGSNYDIYKYAYPILKKYSIPATFFICINEIKLNKDSFKWDEIRELAREGFEIGSHSISHPRLTKKKVNETQEQYEKRVRSELVDSKKILEEKINKPVDFFAYPYGNYNEFVEKEAKLAGYKAMVTVKWDKNYITTNKYRLHRRTILGTYDLDKFINVLKAVADDKREYED